MIVGLEMVERYARDLFRDQLCRASVVLPLPEEEFAQEGIEWLLLIAVLLTSTGILLLQGCEEPFQHQQRSLLRIWLLCRRNEDRGMLCPVRRKLD